MLFMLLLPAVAAAATGWGIFQDGHPGINCGFAPCTQGAFVRGKIGGGGYVTNILIAPTGQQFARTDTSGAYYRTSASQPWTPVITRQSLPSPINVAGALGSVCEIGMAPSNPSHLYMYFRPAEGSVVSGVFDGNAYIFTSTNSGATWTKTDSSFPANSTTQCEGNDAQCLPSYRLKNSYMAVDPANENVVFVSTPSNGIYFTTTGGIGASAWTQISTGTIPGGTDPTPGCIGTPIGGRGNLIAFDPSSTVTGGKTQGIYVTAYGTGVYHSTNGGSTWTELNSAGMPTTFNVLKVDASGTVWVVDDTGNGGSGQQGNLNRYLSGTWSTQISSGTIETVSIDPASSSNVYATQGGGFVYSRNGQVATPTWTTDSNGTFGGSVITWPANAQTATSGGIPSNFIANSTFDPSRSNVMYGGNGIGVVTTSPPTSGTTAYVWNFDETAGIENLVSHWSQYTPAGWFMSAEDRPNWLVPNLNAYSSEYLPDYNHDISGTTASCINGSTYFVTTGFGGSISNSSGAFSTWASYNNGTYVGLTGISPVPPITSAFFGGQCAVEVATPTNAQTIVWNATIQGPYFSTDSGTTFNNCTFTSPTSFGGRGWSPGSATQNRLNMAQDATAPATILIYNDGSGSIASFTGTGSGTNLTVSGISGYLTIGVLITGTGVPANTTIVSQTSGTIGGNGVYVTSNATTSSGAALTAGNGAQALGTWKSTSGCSFTQSSTTNLGSGGLVQIVKGVQGNACHFFSARQVYQYETLPNTGSLLYRSINCGTTWSQISNVESIFALGVGAPNPSGGSGYPAFYCVCWVNNGGGFTFGFWESDNIDQVTPTWTMIGDGYPGGTVDVVLDLNPDPNIYGVIYGLTGTDGPFYRTFN